MTLPLRTTSPREQERNRSLAGVFPGYYGLQRTLKAPSSWTPHSPTRRRRERSGTEQPSPVIQPSLGCSWLLSKAAGLNHSFRWATSPHSKPTHPGLPMPSPPGAQGNKALGGHGVQSPEEGQEQDTAGSSLGPLYPAWFVKASP